MKLKEMTQVELELLSYTDLTEMILEENNKTMSTPEIFKMICGLLNYSEEQYINKIGDFYTSLTTDKRFVLLEDAKWDLKKKHIIPLIVDDEEDEEEIVEIDEEDDEMESVEEKLEVEDDESLDSMMDDDTDISELSIVDEEDLED